jgi:microcystin-dependent protein
MSDQFIGEIRLFAGNFEIAGWAFCDGRLLPISQNQALFALLGTTYGGDGQTTFGLPDLRGRFGVHQGQGTGLSNYGIGEITGAESVTLNVQELPSHTHTTSAADFANDLSPGNHVWSTDPDGNTAAYNSAKNAHQMAAGAISPAGGSQPHDNIQPCLVLNYIIALEGIFPSRN